MEILYSSPGSLTVISDTSGELIELTTFATTFSQICLANDVEVRFTQRHVQVNVVQNSHLTYWWVIIS